jgi:hypothetical protein
MYQLFLNSDFAKMRVNPLSGGIDPITNKFSNFNLKVSAAKYVGETSAGYGTSQQYNDTFASGDTFSFVNGKLIRDFSVIGSADVYKLYTGVVASDSTDLGTWQQMSANNTLSYSGKATLSKTGAVNTYLDPAVWRVKDAVTTGSKYLFPLYTTFTFKFPDAFVSACTSNGQISCPSSQSLNVIFLENGDIVANNTVGTDTTGQCTRDSGQDIPIGTVRAAYMSQDNTNYFVSPNLVLSGASFGLLDGIQVGTSALASKVKINLAGVVNAPAGTQGSINATSAEAVTDSSTGAVTTTPDANLNPAMWVNGYDQFIQLHVNAAVNNSAATQPTAQEKVLANLASGNLSVNTASCYKVMQK